MLAEAMETQSEPEKEPKPRRRRRKRRATKSKKEEEQPEEEQSFPILQTEKPKSQSERSAERLDELKALMDQNRAKKTNNTHNGIGWCWAELLLHRVNSEAEGPEPKDPGHWTWGGCVHCETRTNRIIH